jgi:indolepyruvate ferredoxin oxidoreductase beta subunit
MSVRPVTILIAALGGEGGGVLTDWIVRAAEASGFPVQSTSIPGVAQRTGATTYYIEILPVTVDELNGRRPVLALTPGIGDIDVLVASELLEGARTVANGFVSDRTTAIVSTSRFYAMDEKTAMGDGRLDTETLGKAVRDHARNAVLIDMAALAQRAGAMVNSVMLGALAGCGRVPIPAEAFEAAIRADGKAVEANLRGYKAGIDATSGIVAPAAEKKPSKTDAAALEARVMSSMPAGAQPIVLEGVRRLTAYQSTSYAALYLDRLAPLVSSDVKLLTETARHLAVRMSYEDVVRRRRQDRAGTHGAHRQ